MSLGVLGLASIANSQTIRIGTEGAYPPWNNLNSAGELEGAEIDFGNEACERMGVTCEWVTQDWDGIIPALLQGKYDIIIAGMSITEERKEKVNFTTGYMTDGARFAVLKDSGLADLNIAGMAKVNLNNAGGKEQAAIGQLIAAMDGKTVCVQSSTIHQNFLEKHMSGAVDVKLYQAVDDHNLDLAAGRCDAYLLMSDLSLILWNQMVELMYHLQDQLFLVESLEMVLEVQFVKKTMTFLKCGMQ